MTQPLPVVFWVHSPIGYESFLAFRKSYGAGPVFCGTGRGMNIAEALFALGQPGLYQHQTKAEIDKSANAIREAMTSLIARYGQFILAAPQSAQPYIEALIDSPHCQGYIYYDEGVASYGNIQEKMHPAYHRYAMGDNDSMVALCASLSVDWSTLRNRHRRGVPFFNMKHRKYLGCISFFADAFPGFEPTVLPLPDKSPEQTALCGTHSIVLLNDLLNGVTTAAERGTHINNVKLLSQVLGDQVVLKAHPSDREDDVAALLENSPLMWSRFCQMHSLDPNQEVAFMGFRLYASRNNSTFRYLSNMGQRNALTIY
jgi:hypothetical protein